jgi:starch synthase
MRRLRIALATAGRFHLLDLARELHRLGHDVKLYSFVPRARTRVFGLPDDCHVSLIPFAAPALGWAWCAPGIAPEWREHLLHTSLDTAVTVRLRACDVFICMSGIYLEAARVAKARHGARIWLERASRHIISQDEILAAIPGAERPTSRVIRRELAGYELADRIVIPSTPVEQSFLPYNNLRAKLFRNPYGVDLTLFQPKTRPRNDRFTLLCVGGWSFRKGCDILAAAVEKVSGVHLVHVGEPVDLPFSRGTDSISHVGRVPLLELKEFYAAADAFVLASREEGLPFVIGHALATGLPVICTDRTGGHDYGHTPALAARITVVPHEDVDALASAIAGLRDGFRSGKSLPPLRQQDRETLSWAAYAARYNNELLDAMGRVRE